MYSNMIHVQIHIDMCGDIILYNYPWMPRNISSQPWSVGVQVVKPRDRLYTNCFPAENLEPPTAGYPGYALPVGLMVATLLRSSTRDRPPK